jgi:hypothetical protein
MLLPVDSARLQISFTNSDNSQEARKPRPGANNSARGDGIDSNDHRNNIGSNGLDSDTDNTVHDNNKLRLSLEGNKQCLAPLRILAEADSS